MAFARCRVSRNLRGQRMLPAAAAAERRSLEATVAGDLGLSLMDGSEVQVLCSLSGTMEGEYFPLAGSNSYVPKPGGMSGAPLLSRVGLRRCGRGAAPARRGLALRGARCSGGMMSKLHLTVGELGAGVLGLRPRLARCTGRLRDQGPGPGGERERGAAGWSSRAFRPVGPPLRALGGEVRRPESHVRPAR